MSMQNPKPAQSAEEILARYAAGERVFSHSQLHGANLANAVLDGAVFGGADFSDACLDGASLAETNLIGASFVRASVKGAVISPAAARGVDFFSANLEDADLSTAQCAEGCFIETNLSKATLTSTSFDDAWFGLTKMHDVTLSFSHLGEIKYSTHPERGYKFPCFVNDETIERTSHPFSSDVMARVEDEGATAWMEKQRLVLVNFFSNCGVTMLQMDAAGLLGGSSNFKPSVFISYATADERFAKKLERVLANAGIVTWFAPHRMRGGAPILDQVTSAIGNHDRTLLILSEESMKSPWVRTEILAAREAEERLGRRVLFPIRLSPFTHLSEWKVFDADRGIDLAREIRALFIPDFSDWESTWPFETAVSRLVADLRQSIGVGA